MSIYLQLDITRLDERAFFGHNGAFIFGGLGVNTGCLVRF